MSQFLAALDRRSHAFFAVPSVGFLKHIIPVLWFFLARRRRLEERSEPLSRTIRQKIRPSVGNRWSNRFWKPGRGQNGFVICPTAAPENICGQIPALLPAERPLSNDLRVRQRLNLCGNVLPASFADDGKGMDARRWAVEHEYSTGEYTAKISAIPW
jgi:hypothetical protein